MSFWNLFKKKRKDPFQSQLEQSMPSSSTPRRSPYMSYGQPKQSSSSYNPYRRSTPGKKFNSSAYTPAKQSSYQSRPTSANQYQTPAPTQPDRKTYQAPQGQQKEPQNPSQQYLGYMNEKAVPNLQDRTGKRSQAAYDAYARGVGENDNVVQKGQDKMMGQIPSIQNQANNYSESAQGNIDLARQGTDAATASLERKAAYSSRSQAKAKKRQDSQRQNMFANLGTLESGGHMGFAGQQKQGDEDYMVARANAEAGTQEQVAQLELGQQAYEHESYSKVQAELEKFNQIINDIVADVNIAEAQKTQYAGQALTMLQENLFGIQSDYDNQMNQFEQNKYDIASSLEEDDKDDKYDELDVEIGDLLGQLQGRDLAPVTGGPGIRRYLPGEVRDTRTLINRLSSQLQLKAAKLLKGGGSISDAERKILADAVTVLSDQYVSEELAALEIQKLVQFYGTGSGGGEWEVIGVENE